MLPTQLRALSLLWKGKDSCPHTCTNLPWYWSQVWDCPSVPKGFFCSRCPQPQYPEKVRFSLLSTTSGAGRASVHISSSPTHLTSFYSYNITLSDLQQLQLKPKTMKTSSYSLYILCFPLSHCLQQERGPEIPDVYFLRFVNYLRHVNIKALWAEGILLI